MRVLMDAGCDRELLPFLGDPVLALRLFRREYDVEAEGCARLWRAVLVRAFEDLGDADPVVRVDALRFIAGDDGALAYVCGAVGLRPARVREGARRAAWGRV